MCDSSRTNFPMIQRVQNPYNVPTYTHTYTHRDILFVKITFLGPATYNRSFTVKEEVRQFVAQTIKTIYQI